MLGRIQFDENEEEWVTCPYCGKKNLKINSKTVIHNLCIKTTNGRPQVSPTILINEHIASVIHNLSLKCKGSNCKKEFNVCIPERSWSNAEEM